MNQLAKNTLFEELMGIYGDTQNPISQNKIREVIGRASKLLEQGGMNINDIIPKGFYKSHGWKNGLVHEVFSEEYYTKLAHIIGSIHKNSGLQELLVLEVGAGNGAFSKHLKTKLSKNITLIATDIEPCSNTVEKYGFDEAIKKYKPHLVIACWPLILGNIEDSESPLIRALSESPNTQGCFLIGVPSRCQFDEDWFMDYQEESGSTFTNIMDIPELSHLQIGMPNTGGDVPIKNGVNPILLRDQGIDDTYTCNIGDTYTTSRTSYISRGNPQW